VIVRYLRNPYDFITRPKAGLFREARERDLAAGRVSDSQSPDSLNWLNLGTIRIWSRDCGAVAAVPFIALLGLPETAGKQLSLGGGGGRR
jgi:hypothetical protein